MARSLERITLLTPILIVTGMTLAATFVIAMLARRAARANRARGDRGVE